MVWYELPKKFPQIFIHVAYRKVCNIYVLQKPEISLVWGIRAGDVIQSIELLTRK